MFRLLFTFLLALAISVPADARTIPSLTDCATAAQQTDRIWAARGSEDCDMPLSYVSTAPSAGANVASASTVNLDTATGSVLAITGTTTITAVTLAEGKMRYVRFTGILTLTNGASLVLPGSANITTAVGDHAVFIGGASGVVRVLYMRADGRGVAGLSTQAKDDVDIDGGDVDVSVGASTGVVKTGGTYCFIIAASGNVTTGEDDLNSCVLPALALSTGKGVKITAFGSAANTAAAKTLKLKFGTETILTNTLATSLTQYWNVTAWVKSTATDVQAYGAFLDRNGTGGISAPDYEAGTALSQDDGAPITIKLTGEATNTNDITNEILIVEFIN